SGHTPTGSVNFKFGTTDLGTVPLVGGVASLPTSALPIGSPDTVTATYLGDTNYATSGGTVNITVTGVLLTVAADPQSKVYGATLPALTFTPTGFVNGDTALTALTGALATAATAATGVGSYPITQGTLAGANYTITFTGNNLAVTPAPLTVTAN